MMQIISAVISFKAIILFILSIFMHILQKQLLEHLVFSHYQLHSCLHVSNLGQMMLMDLIINAVASSSFLKDGRNIQAFAFCQWSSFSFFAWEDQSVIAFQLFFWTGISLLECDSQLGDTSVCSYQSLEVVSSSV